jgi:hypothetical protein
MSKPTLLFAVLVMVFSCNQQESEPKATEATEATEAMALTDEAVDEAELPVKEDFEDEAFGAIDEDNLEAEIDALEKEIAGDAK